MSRRRSLSVPNKSSTAQQPASSTPKDEAVSAPTVTLTAQEKKIKLRCLELEQELAELKQELAELAQKKALQARKAVTVGVGANNNNQEAEELEEEMAAVVLAEGLPLVTLSAEGTVICMDGVLDHRHQRRRGPIMLAPLPVELTGLDAAAPGDVADKGLWVILGLYVFDTHVRLHQLDCAVVLTQLLALPAPAKAALNLETMTTASISAEALSEAWTAAATGLHLTLEAVLRKLWRSMQESHEGLVAFLVRLSTTIDVVTKTGDPLVATKVASFVTLEDALGQKYCQDNARALLELRKEMAGRPVSTQTIVIHWKQCLQRVLAAEIVGGNQGGAGRRAE
jgi:hypothetical protein